MGDSPATNEAGQEFQKYRLREPLSDSFLGTRYRAVPAAEYGAAAAASNAFGSDARALRTTAVALRLLRAPTTLLIERVARAAKAVRFIDHPNLLAPIQLIRAQTRLAVITQDIEGVTLSEVMRAASAHGEGLPQAVVLRIAIDLLDGVQALHASEAGAKHYTYACGGLTPDSVHVGRDGRARFIDPGIAGAAAAVPCWGHDPIALAYTAPEQSGAEPSFCPQSDVFSIGVMIWEMLSGRSLFGAPTAAETLEHLHNTEIPRVQRQHFVRGEPISAAVAHVVLLALQRDPALRPATSRELAEALRDSADVGTPAEVAERCQRTAGASAGVFRGTTRVRTRGGAGNFELPTGTLPRIQLPPADPAPVPVAPDSFEPQTARMQPLPSAATAAASKPPEPISAFPISDFIRARPSTRRLYAPLAAAAVVLLGISYLTVQELRGGDAPGAAAATSQPPPITTTSAAQPPAALDTPAPAPLPAPAPSAEPMPVAFGGPSDARTTGSTPPAPSDTLAPAPRPASGSSARSRRRARAAAALEAAKATSPSTESGNTTTGPFIPDHL